MRGHGWFLGVFGAGVVLRVVTMLGYRPALWFPDTYTYVVTAMRPRPDLVRPAGYSLLLRLLEPFHSFALVTVVQHAMGLATGALVYLVVLRRGGPRWAAVLASAPVLLDAYEIEMEHLLASDTLFTFLVVTAVCVVLWRRPLTWRLALAAGLLLSIATLTRSAGLPLVVVFGFFLFRYGYRHARAVPLVFLAATLVPVAAYAGWFTATYHRVGLVGANGVFLYARTMSFADCAIMRPPADLAVLCDPRPPDQRPPSQYFVWDENAPLVRLPGITFTQETDTLAGRFAALAIRSQPADYAGSVLVELARSFAPGRPVYPDAETYAYYQFPETAPPPPDRFPATVGADFARRYEQGPIGTQVAEPYAGWMRAYQSVVALPEPLLLMVLLVPPVVAVAARRARPRRGALLPWTSAWVLLLVPAATAEFDYRYVLPAVPLACLAAALSVPVRAARTDPALGEVGETVKNM
ncbi:hypothetical protein J5X84_03365 [Streptosporangiaceae bacterium NEAU-GS5]|nr:hypothetical protein [Streptosporangiaceae bacterium NEAU-GS5]